MPLEFKKISTPPDHRNASFQADYYEFICLLSIGKTITKADILGDAEEEEDLSTDALRHTLEDTDEIDETLKETSKEVRDDARRQMVNEVFDHIHYRVAAFGESYPFEITKRSILRLKVAPSQLSELNKLYIFLLVASQLPKISPTHVFTSAFEIVSQLALSNYLPSRAQVVMFGTNSLKTDKSWTGSLSKRIRKLVVELRARAVDDNINKLSPQNTGDNGLDLVAWLPFGNDVTGARDDGPGLLSVFGQCACSVEDWSSKISESHEDNWTEFFHLKSAPVNFIFVPFCYRDSGGAWIDISKIARAIMFDRLRLIHMLWKLSDPIAQLPYHLIDEILNQRMALINLQ